jgi:hypothetical protein
MSSSKWAGPRCSVVGHVVKSQEKDMRRTCLPTLILVCAFVAFVNVLLAQINHNANVDQAGALPDVQEPPAKFAKVAAYGSGGDYAESVAIGDVNGDGNPDLVLAAGNTIGILLGNGDGTFQTPVPLNYFADSVALADVNGDGNLDIVATTEGGQGNGDGTVEVLLGNGNGTFQPPRTYDAGGYDTVAIAVADLVGDGSLDLVVANVGSSSVGVLLGDGHGNFGVAVSYASGGYNDYSVAIGDVNGDGYPDLVVANQFECSSCYNGGVSVLLANGDGTFQTAVSYDSGGTYARSVAVADLSANGKLDVVVANAFYSNDFRKDGAVSVLAGNGDGTFEEAVAYSSGGYETQSVAVADVNGDGVPDLVVLSCSSNSDCTGANKEGRFGILLGNSDGTFQAARSYGSGGFDGQPLEVSLAIADVNGDGRPDLLAPNLCNVWTCGGSGWTGGTVGVLLNLSSVSTVTTLTSSPNPSEVNQSATLTAAITSSPVIPNGELVTFYDGKAILGMGTTTNGEATLTTFFSTAGKYSIKASYPGDAFHKASSGTVKQVVNP